MFGILLLLGFACYCDCSKPKRLALDTFEYKEAAKKLREENGDPEESEDNLDMLDDIPIEGFDAQDVTVGDDVSIVNNDDLARVVVVPKAAEIVHNPVSEASNGRLAAGFAA
jgi:hypothetical protein